VFTNEKTQPKFTKNPQPNNKLQEHQGSRQYCPEKQIIWLISCGLGGMFGKKGPLQDSPEGVRHMLQIDSPSA